MKSRSDKAFFRKNWCALKLEMLTTIANRDADYYYVDTTKGTMMSGHELIAMVGVEDAKYYIMKCARMGEPWIDWCNI
eukprot:14457505-Heterocapsa_arctica.AAC.1